MSLEELLQEHIKALNENTKALVAYTNAVRNEVRAVDVEHTKDSACRFCGITYKTLQAFSDSGQITPYHRQNGKREYFKETDLVGLCESKRLYSGEYGEAKNNPASVYYAR